MEKIIVTIDKSVAEWSPDELFGDFYDCPNCKKSNGIYQDYSHCPYCGCQIEWSNERPLAPRVIDSEE